MSIDSTARKFLGTDKVETRPGQQSDLEARQAHLASVAAKEALRKATAFTEEIITWLNQRAIELDLDAEERIFAVSLATINLRQNFPAERGGKEFFDKVSHRAWEYYDANK